MTQPLTPRDHALKVAMLDALSAAVDTEYQKARADAEQAFRDVRKNGQTTQQVLLPDADDTPVGLISIRGRSLYPAWNKDFDLLGWCEKHLPEGIEEYVEPGAFGSADVIAVIKDKFPHLVKRRVRTSTAEALVKQVVDNGGKLRDESTGESEKVAEVNLGPVTGKFAFSGGGTDERRRRLMAAWMNGPLADRLRAVAFSPLALPAPPAETPEAPEGWPFDDEEHADGQG